MHSIDEGIHVTAKNRSGSAAVKALKTTVKQLRAELDRADARAKRLKSKAARLKEASTDLEAQVKRLKKRNKRLKKATRAAEGLEPAVTTEPSLVAEVSTPVLTPATGDLSPTVTSQPFGTPDASWTVVQLREEARLRGLTGLSGKTKAQLLAALG